MKQTLTTLILTLLISLASVGPTHAQRFLSYEPEVVELAGQLVLQSKYGPPNFGEQPNTDQKVSVPVLLLRDRVSVLGDQGDGHNAKTVYGVRQVQLAFKSSETSHKTLIGKQVVVTGSLFHAHTGHHYTNVVLNVQSIERKPAGYDQRLFAVCGIYTSYYDLRKNFKTSQFLEAEFRALFAGEETKKSVKLSGTGRIINAALDYTDFSGWREGNPVTLMIAISLSDKEEYAIEADGGVTAVTNYKRDWHLSVKDRVVVGEIEYSLTLSCYDGNKQKKRY